VDVVTQFPRGREPSLNVHIVLFANAPGSFRVVLIDCREKEGDGVLRLGEESSRKEMSESIALVYSGSCERSAMPEAMRTYPASVSAIEFSVDTCRNILSVEFPMS